MRFEVDQTLAWPLTPGVSFPVRWIVGTYGGDCLIPASVEIRYVGLSDIELAWNIPAYIWLYSCKFAGKRTLSHQYSIQD